jgi:hypothetical protein
MVRGFHFATEEESSGAVGTSWEDVELAGGFVASFVLDATMEWRDFADDPDYYSFVTVTKGSPHTPNPTLNPQPQFLNSKPQTPNP